MAAIMPNTPRTGNNIPISSYVARIAKSYPNVNRQRMVESSINSKETIDFLPTNIGVDYMYLYTDIIQPSIWNSKLMAQ